jgi:serine/threonine-protein kinase
MSSRAFLLRSAWRGPLALALTFCPLVAAPRVAHAQTSADDKAAAEALFDQGLELMQAGKYAEACQRLESSQRVDPGVGTLLYLGECYEKLGKTASAWATFREAASAANAAGQTDRANIGTERAQKLMPRLLRLQLELAPELEGLEGLEILRDGKSVPRALWGTPVPVDPGEHALEVRAPGHETFRTAFRGEGEGKTETLQLPALKRLPESADPPSGQQGSPAGAGAVSMEDAPSDGSAQRTSGLVLGGLGVIGVGVGSFFGLRAIQKNKDAEESCSGSSCSTPAGVELTNDALNAARISNVAFIAGGALLAGGVVLYLTAPKQQEVARVQMVPTVGGAQLSLGGNF